MIISLGEEAQQHAKTIITNITHQMLVFKSKVIIIIEKKSPVERRHHFVGNVSLISLFVVRMSFFLTNATKLQSSH
jgi:hypothetical protein